MYYVLLSVHPSFVRHMCVVMDCKVSSAMQCNRLVLAVVLVLVLVVPVLLAQLVQLAYGEQRVAESEQQ